MSKKFVNIIIGIILTISAYPVSCASVEQTGNSTTHSVQDTKRMLSRTLILERGSIDLRD